MATVDSLEVLTGKRSVSEMSDEELREHLRQIRQVRILPKTKTVTKAKTTQAKSRTTKSPFDALLRSLSAEELELMDQMMKELTDEQANSAD
jgi:hypothetical protein